MPEQITNREGLTFHEWFKAANAWGANVVDKDTGRKAWMAGEDPTEYAARANESEQPVIVLCMR